MKIIKIDKPCEEDWGKMINCSEGKFCTSCSKNVIDFTKMGTSEIADYLRVNSNNKICGRFNSFQLNGKTSLFDKTLNFIYRIENKFIKVALGGLVSCIVFIIGCTTKSNPSTQPSSTTLGAPSQSISTDTTESNIDTSNNHVKQ